MDIIHTATSVPMPLTLDEVEFAYPDNFEKYGERLGAEAVFESMQRHDLDEDAVAAELQAIVDEQDRLEAERLAELEAKRELRRTGTRRLIIAGGVNDGCVLSTVEMFDPDEMDWFALPEMRCPRWGHAASVVDNKIVVCGGYVGTYSSSIHSL